MSKCDDSYTGKDKVKHFGACLALSAIAKEAYDMKQNGNHWCWKDIVADVVGIIIGTVAHIIIIALLI